LEYSVLCVIIPVLSLEVFAVYYEMKKVAEHDWLRTPRRSDRQSLEGRPMEALSVFVTIEFAFGLFYSVLRAFTFAAASFIAVAWGRFTFPATPLVSLWWNFVTLLVPPLIVNLWIIYACYIELDLEHFR